MTRRVSVIFAFALLTAACASSGTPGAGADDAERNRLTTEQIEAANLPNAYELVSRLRRAWLRDDPLTARPVVVYMDDRELGGAERLREIPAVTVAELRYVTNEEAVMRWSAGVEGSVIVVVPRR